MSQPYVGEIRMFGGNFAPAGWAFCNGALQPISENETLFQLIGTTYGGDGQETFALPNLCGRVPLHRGTDPSGNNYVIGQQAGVETVTLTTNQIPVHNHAMVASTDIPASLNPAGNLTGQAAAKIYRNGSPSVTLHPQSIGSTGGNQPHENMQPYLAVSFIISLFGIFPTQS